MLSNNCYLIYLTNYVLKKKKLFTTLCLKCQLHLTVARYHPGQIPAFAMVLSPAQLITQHNKKILNNNKKNKWRCIENRYQNNCHFLQNSTGMEKLSE